MIENYSGKEIHYIYTKRSDYANWSPDLLGRNTILKHGKSFTVNLGSNPAVHYDVKVVYKGGKSSWWAGINVYTYSNIRISGEGTISKRKR